VKQKADDGIILVKQKANDIKKQADDGVQYVMKTTDDGVEYLEEMKEGVRERILFVLNQDEEGLDILENDTLFSVQEDDRGNCMVCAKASTLEENSIHLTDDEEETEGGSSRSFLLLSKTESDDNEVDSAVVTTYHSPCAKKTRQYRFSPLSFSKVESDSRLYEIQVGSTNASSWTREYGVEEVNLTYDDEGGIDEGGTDQEDESYDSDSDFDEDSSDDESDSDDDDKSAESYDEKDIYAPSSSCVTDTTDIPNSLRLQESHSYDSGVFSVSELSQTASSFSREHLSQAASSFSREHLSKEIKGWSNVANLFM